MYQKLFFIDGYFYQA